MKNKKIIGIIIAANLAVGVVAFAQDATQSDSSQIDQQKSSQDSAVQTPPLPTADEPAGAATGTFEKEKFLKDAAKSGVAEVNMAKIGTQKAQDPTLKEAAQKIMTDHSSLNDQLKELAQKKGVTLSTEIDQKHQKMIDHISGLSGSEFDKAFASHMVQGHKKSIAKFKQAATSDDTEVSQLAQQALPKLQEHLTTVQKFAPDATAGGTVEEPAGADTKADELKDDSSKPSPDYKSSDEEKKSDLP